MHLRMFDGIPTVFAFAAARSYVFVAVCMLLSGGMLGVRGWAATETARPLALALAAPGCSVTTGSISNDWLHARLSTGPISLVISVIAGFFACLLTTDDAAPSKSTILRVHSSAGAAAHKSLCRSFCLLLASCALVIAVKLQ